MTKHQRTAEKFQGYCFLEVNGEYLPPVELDGAEAAWRWAFNPFRLLFPEIRVTDSGDHCILHVVNGELRFPTPTELNMPPEKVQAFVQALKEGKV